MGCAASRRNRREYGSERYTLRPKLFKIARLQAAGLNQMDFYPRRGPLSISREQSSLKVTQGCLYFRV